MIGPGKYNDLVTEIRQRTKAVAAILIVIDGVDGNGFECQADMATTLRLPEILEHMAAEIRAGHRQGRL